MLSNAQLAPLKAYIDLHQASFPQIRQEFKRLVPLLQVKQIKAGQKIIEEGSSTTFIAFVNSGSLRQYCTTNDGVEHILYLYFENSFVTDIHSISTKRPALYDIEAIEPCELIVLDSRMLEPMYNQFHWAERVARLEVEAAYRDLMRRFVEKNTQTAMHRYQKLQQARPDIIQRLPLKYIASYLGIKPQSLSRIRKKEG